MKHLAILVLSFVAACGDAKSGGSATVGSYDAAADQTVKAMNEFGGILDTVKDKASADAAKPKLEALAKRLDGIVAAVEKLGPSTGAAKTDEKMRAGFASMSPKVLAYIERIMSAPEAGKALEQPFAAVQRSFMQLRGKLGG